MGSLGLRPWKFQFYFNEIKELVSHLQMEFHHEFRLVNSMAATISKQGVDRVELWLAFTM